MTTLRRETLRGIGRARLIGTGAVVAGVVGVAVAASRNPAPRPDDALRTDLAAAAASATFAPAIRGRAPVQFVSPLELGESPAPTGSTRSVGPAPVASRYTVTRSRALRTVSRTTVEHVPVRTVAARTLAVTPAPAAIAPDAAPSPRATEELAVATAEPATAGAGTYTAPTSTGPSPSSGPADEPSGNSRRHGGWTLIPSGHGEWGGRSTIGILIRGGRGGDDHCGRPGTRTPLPGSIGGGGMRGGRWPGRL